MSMRELPFGARISDSFVKKLKWEAAKANEERSGVLPCLCVQEKQHREAFLGREQKERAVNLFQQLPEVPPVNRLVRPAPPTPSPAILIKERVWRLAFDRRKYSPKATFEIDGLQLHISERAQAELKGATLRVLDDKIVVTYEPV